MSRPLALLLPALALALTTAGCAGLGPDFRPPAPPPLSGAAFVSGSAPPFGPGELPDDWWRLYADDELDRLVRQALEANRDIAVAAANLRRARAALRETRTLRLPQTGVSGAGTYARDPSLGSDLGFDAGLDISYEVDLFGRVARSIEAARADAGQAAAVLDVVRVSVAAETARAYVNACAATARTEVARASLAIQERTALLTRRQVEAGRGTRLDVARTQGLREQTAATIPPLEAERESALFRLATLTGRAPSAMPPASFSCRAAPRMESPIPIGDGAGLLRRRPDIRQAERALAAATARIGVATADLYPRIVLGGSIGGSLLAGDGGAADGFRFGLGPLISWSFPNLAAARARVRQAEASAAAALASFDAAVLAALEETETALTRYARELDRRAALQAAREQSLRAADIARMRFRAGVDSSLSVLDAERTLSEVEAALAQSDAQIADFQITLFKALGGGWRQAGLDEKDQS